MPNSLLLWDVVCPNITTTKQCDIKQRHYCHSYYFLFHICLHFYFSMLYPFICYISVYIYIYIYICLLLIVVYSILKVWHQVCSFTCCLNYFRKRQGKWMMLTHWGYCFIILTFHIGFSGLMEEKSYSLAMAMTWVPSNCNHIKYNCFWKKFPVNFARRMSLLP